MKPYTEVIEDKLIEYIKNNREICIAAISNESILEAV